MQTILTGPDTCAQCGAQIDGEAVLAEAVATGTSEAVKSAYVLIRGHKVTIPGLYWDRACAARVESGELESTLTLGAALAFLDDIWGPSVALTGLKAIILDSDELAEMSATRLADISEVSLLLEAIIAALEEGSDLSWLPECDGHCGCEESTEVDPRSVAHLN